MRPTIPIGDWRIAVDLNATRKIQNQPGTPAFGCKCRWCLNWSLVWSSALPLELSTQLQRLGIDIPHPTDLYAFEETENGANCRIIFHVVGKLLSGPITWREDPRVGRMLNYISIRESPTYIGVAVLSCRETFNALPQLTEGSIGNLLQIDLRLLVPLAGDAKIPTI